MVSHVMVGAHGIDRAKRVYAYHAVLGVLGVGEGIRNACSSGQKRRFCRRDGATAIDSPPGPRQDPSGALHLADIRDPGGSKRCAMPQPA
ncbi:MAG: hypothetical protein ACUVVU_04150 [Tepidimonas sp.]|uniref:hypothetical protein n=1 Tax=Tepidimonas sp. TaxID=2002775 RepID=UPI004054F2FB